MAKKTKSEKSQAQVDAAADRKASAVDGFGQFIGQPLVAGWDHRALVICIHRISRHLVLYP